MQTILEMFPQMCCMSYLNWMYSGFHDQCPSSVFHLRLLDGCSPVSGTRGAVDGDNYGIVFPEDLNAAHIPAAASLNSHTATCVCLLCKDFSHYLYTTASQGRQGRDIILI